jgi:prepilin-type N-terminal cleavage/methylation domain-containing protein
VRQRPEQGFSLVEMLAVLTILGLITLAAWPLVDEATATIHRGDTAAIAPRVERLGAMIRADLEAGLVASNGTPGPALELAMPTGGSVRWRLDGATLTREARDPAGVLVGRRFELPGVRAFAWQPIGDGLLELHLTWRVVSVVPPAVARVGSRSGSATTTAVWRVARRGGKEGLSW